MSTQVTRRAALADACVVCPPGDVPAALPKATADPAVRAYQCSFCGARWRTRWGRDGWPVSRDLEPVTPEQADENRAVLKRVLRGAA